MDLKEFSEQVKRGEINKDYDYYLYDEEYIIVDDHQNNDFCVTVTETESDKYKYIGPYVMNKNYSRFYPNKEYIKIQPNNAIDGQLFFDLNFNKENYIGT